MIKDHLIENRIRAGFSQEKVAEELGISRQAYGKWEQGKSVPDVEKCTRLAQLYGVSLDELIHGTKLLSNSLAPAGKYIFGTVVLSQKGQLVIPKHAREVFHLKPGDRLVLLGDEEQGLALVREEDLTKRMKETARLMAMREPDDPDLV